MNHHSLSLSSVQGLNVPLEALALNSAMRKAKLDLRILRLDKIHPLLSGNKWFKLMPQLSSLKGQSVMSFGGPYSNHIHALAWAGAQVGCPTIGIIRGEKQITPTLEDAKQWGMKIRFLPRQQYRLKEDEAVLGALKREFGEVVVIPEGGTNASAVLGTEQIWKVAGVSQFQPDLVLVPVGTGGTMAGLVRGAPTQCYVQGISVFSKFDSIEESVRRLIAAPELTNWSVQTALALRYGAINSELAALFVRAADVLGVEFDSIYTLRVLHYLCRALLMDQIRPGSRVMLIHTGGLQGNRGQYARLNKLAPAFCGPVPL